MLLVVAAVLVFVGVLPTVYALPGLLMWLVLSFVFPPGSGHRPDRSG